ncbi:GDSL esterase/lipase At1g29660-like [Chenopodium quinoa]|uniref:GDSL esterase/lipase n=1 Tax=Chenopodium quinoa TaxID=63459 RepID=A0A803MDT6_CHEQI|nr:GDSL esterase/lipase At1g29660-like [Chenopodium quinoa]
MTRGAVVVLALLLMISSTTFVRCEPQVPCYFVFGDSLSDPGNNNDLNTKAKANYPPYGIDFPGGVATGRFSNGRNFVDRITELLGFDEYIPPYSTAKGRQILKGVNYASGAAGIRSETGQHLGDRISMDQQLVNHGLTVAKIPWYGFTALRNLGKCLYTVNIGNNDYINNYFNSNYSSSSIYYPEEYAQALISKYGLQLKSLYLLGARKIAVFGVGLVGCTLGEIYTFGPSEGSLCVDKINEAVKIFNEKLINLVDDLTMELPGAQFTYIGASSSTDTGSAVANTTCCKVRDDFQCVEFDTVCEGRDNYIFWDGYHPTEVVNILSGESAYSGINSKYIHPVDIKTLVSCDREFMLRKVKDRISTRLSSA